MSSQSEVEAEAQVTARDNFRRTEDLCESTIALGGLLRKAEDSVKRKRFAPLLGLRLSFIMEDVKQIIEDIESIDHALNDPECVIPPESEEFSHALSKIAGELDRARRDAMRLVSDAEAKRGLFSPPALPVIPEGEDLYTCLTQREATCPSCNKRGKLEVELDGRRISRVSCGFCEYQMFKPATRNEKYFRLFGVLTMGALAVYFWPSSEATKYATQDASGDYVGALMSYAVLTLPSCLMASWSLGLILSYLKRRGDGLMVAAKAVGLEFK